MRKQTRLFEAERRAISPEERFLRIATWNLNNRVGRTRFRPEAAHAAIALGAYILVFTEFFPQQNENLFRTTLEDVGWREQLMSAQTSEVANRVLVASRQPLAPLIFNLPTFDEQFPANIIGFSVSCFRLSILGVRVPAYKSSSRFSPAPAPPARAKWQRRGCRLRN